MPDAVNISQIQQYAEQFRTELLTIATIGMGEFRNDFTVVPGIKDKYTLTSLQFNNLLKPYKKAVSIPVWCDLEGLH